MAYFLTLLWQKLKSKFGASLTEFETRELIVDIAASVIGFATDFPPFVKTRGLTLFKRESAFKEEMLGYYSYLITVRFSKETQLSSRLTQLIDAIKKYDSSPFPERFSFSSGDTHVSASMQTTYGCALIRDRLQFYQSNLNPTGPSSAIEAMEALKLLIAYAHSLPLRRVTFRRGKIKCEELCKELMASKQPSYYGQWPDPLRDEVIEDYIGITVSPIMSQIDDLFECLRTGRRPKSRAECKAVPPHL
jgi:hypothetical protein